MPPATRRGAPGVDRRGPSDEASVVLAISYLEQVGKMLAKHFSRARDDCLLCDYNHDCERAVVN